ncbi:hypothetical protein LBMAG48_20370 [Phycisphaerae bacterium]|nr:hypothetical protein LBMAG48_20370 [Phycisphaerae bacterium]
MPKPFYPAFMLRLALPLAILLAILLSVLAFDKPAPKADFTFINRGDVSTLDLATISWMQDLRVARMVYEGLTRNDIFTDNFETKPAVAERWEISPDGRTYTFFLRKNAKWTNGSPVTARDFHYSWRRSMTPDLAGDYIKLFALIQGGKEFIAWRIEQIKLFAQRPEQGETRRVAAEALWQETKAKFDELVAITVVDDYTLRVTLVRPTPYFLDLTSFAPLYPIYPPLVEAHTSIDPVTAIVKTRPDWTKPPALITNGPFELVTWRFKRDMRFEQNPHYWDKASLHIRSIAIPSIQDGNAQVLAFQTGAVDWVSDVTPQYRGEMLLAKEKFYEEHASEVARLRAQGLDPMAIDRQLPPDPRKNIHAFPAFGTYFYNFNCLPRLPDGRPNPFADSRVRKAFALTIDKQSVTTNIRRSGEPVAATLIPPGALPGYTSPKGVGYNPALARELLEQAGYPAGNGLPAIELMFNKEGGHDLIAQAIAKDWERELGVRVQLQMKEIKVFREDLKNANYMISRAAWFGDYGDPTTFLDLSETANGNNDRKFSNPAYDALLEQARNEIDPAKRLAILAEAERMLVEDQFPLVPIFHYKQLYLFDASKLTGISSHPRQEQNMYRIDVLGDGIGADEPILMREGDPTKGRFRVGE